MAQLPSKRCVRAFSHEVLDVRNNVVGHVDSPHLSRKVRVVVRNLNVTTQ